MRRRLGLAVLLMLSAALRCRSASPPGKPVLIGCRSPEKETFTCWWEPGFDGGLTTRHRLFYEKEGSEEVHECPDYWSAGKNSCFFGKEQTSIWVEYSLTVVAFNALGNTSSDLFKIDDVMKIVKPYTPENVTVLVNDTANTPYLCVSWNHPPKVDTKSGWTTIKYELRVQKEDSKPEIFHPNKKNSFKVYNVDPGATYTVDMRCQLDQSTWSEWSTASVVKIPNYFQNEKPFWILVSIFSVIPLLATICIVVLKRKFVKQWLLPPVPGPKIRGVDVQLLKSGRAEDVINALIGNQNFPPAAAWMDQTEEYLLVSDSNDWLLTDPYISQKKKSLVIPAGVQLEIQCRTSAPAQSDCENAEVGKDGKVEPDHLAQTKESVLNVAAPSVSSGSKEAASGNAAGPTGYVDIQQHKGTQGAGPNAAQWDYSWVKEVNGETIFILKNEDAAAGLDVPGWEENTAADYSRVKEVNGDDVVLLQKHDSADSSCKKKEDRSAEWTNQKAKSRHGSDCGKGACLQITGNGYVDSVPRFYVE